MANSLLEEDLGPSAKTSACADYFAVIMTRPNAYTISRTAAIDFEKKIMLGRIAQTRIQRGQNIGCVFPEASRWY